MQDLKDCMSYLRQRMFAMEGWKLEDTPTIRIYLGPQPPKMAGDSGAGTENGRRIEERRRRGTTFAMGCCSAIKINWAHSGFVGVWLID